MAKFKKKPVVIDATCFNPEGKNFSDIKHLLFGFEVRGTSYMEVHNLLGTSGCSSKDPYWNWSTLGVIDTLEGKMVCEPGDWIIKGVNGEFYPCKPDIFEKTYEPAE